MNHINIFPIFVTVSILQLIFISNLPSFIWCLRRFFYANIFLSKYNVVNLHSEDYAESCSKQYFPIGGALHCKPDGIFLCRKIWRIHTVSTF